MIQRGASLTTSTGPELGVPGSHARFRDEMRGTLGAVGSGLCTDCRRLKREQPSEQGGSEEWAFCEIGSFDQSRVLALGRDTQSGAVSWATCISQSNFDNLEASVCVNL